MSAGATFGAPLAIQEDQDIMTEFRKAKPKVGSVARVQPQRGLHVSSDVTRPFRQSSLEATSSQTQIASLVYLE